MNYYTSQIPVTLAEKLKEKRMPIPVEFIPNYLGDPEGEAISKIVPPSFAFVFDWLMEMEVFVTVPPIGKLEDGSYRFEATITYDDATNEEYLGGYTWHEAANAAIERALELI